MKHKDGWSDRQAMAAYGVCPLSYRIDDAVRATGISRAVLYRKIKDGSLKLIKIGRTSLIDAASLRQLLGVAE